jgi:hypothetical protein
VGRAPRPAADAPVGFPDPKMHSKKQTVQEFVAARGWNEIGEKEWSELRNALPNISEQTLRSSNIRIRAPWRGVATHSITELENSLRDLTDVYETRPDLRRYCRDQVIAAKDRARWAARSPKIDGAKQRMKAEMVEWMLVWLDDPAIFPTWVHLRKRKMG